MLLPSPAGSLSADCFLYLNVQPPPEGTSPFSVTYGLLPALWQQLSDFFWRIVSLSLHTLAWS